MLSLYIINCLITAASLVYAINTRNKMRFINTTCFNHVKENEIYKILVNYSYDQDTTQATQALLRYLDKKKIVAYENIELKTSTVKKLRHFLAINQQLSKENKKYIKDIITCLEIKE